MLKQFLPVKIKQFLWYLFKAPQRKWIGYKTLFTDFSGWVKVRIKASSIQPVSVCIGVKNRSSNLLQFVVGSLNQCEHPELIELSVFDCGSNDVQDMESILRTAWKGKLVYNREEQDFARSIAFNRAVEQSGYELILVCDADMSVPKNIVGKVNRYCTNRSAWFPEVTYINEDGSRRYYTESTGMFASRKMDFIKAGRFDESIRTWGKEDWLLFFGFYRAGISCIRTKEPDFVHHYHPSLKPDDFVPLF
jgi:glycosyltransferase involved in cell wall biosynthesis